MKKYGNISTGSIESSLAAEEILNNFRPRKTSQPQSASNDTPMVEMPRVQQAAEIK